MPENRWDAPPGRSPNKKPRNGNAKSNKSKRGHSLNTLRAKTVRTSEAWIHSIFRVINLLLMLVWHFLAPEIILGRAAALVGLMRRIRKNSNSPGLRACSISP